MRFVYATDLHGNRNAIEQVFALAQTEQADTIVFGGDLTPKSVAIKLARYSDPSKEDIEMGEGLPLLGGEALPVDMLQKDANQPTFSQSLRNIRLLNKRVGADALAVHLERKGAIIVEQTNRYYGLDSMFAEQVLLDKLLAFFQTADPPTTRFRLQLSDEEIEIVRDCIVEWFKEFEATWDEKRRAGFARKCALTFGQKEAGFEQFAPSNYFEECILYEISGSSLSDTILSVEKLLREKKGRMAEYLLRTFHDARDRLFRAGSYKGLIEEAHIAALVEYSTIAQLKREMESLPRVGQEQAKFLREYFLPFVREWRASHDNKPVYAMLGNDDIIENVSLLDEAERDGVLCHIHGKVHEFGSGFAIVGYSFVETLPPNVGYRAWVKNEAEILSDLRSLRAQVGQNAAVWAIHNPPIGFLDRIEKGNAGSKGVLQFLTETQPRLALFGHIHEAPRLTGSCTAQLGETLCVNPGGEHSKDLQAVLINTKTLEIERRNTL